jgi:hypothetical protein
VVQLVIDVDEQLERARDFLGSIPNATEQATARALNKAAAAGREQAVRSITDRYAVNASDIREKITVRAARASDLSSAVVARSGSLALGYFPHTPVEIGTGGPGRPVLRAEILRGRTRDVVGAFVAPIGGKPRIMIRAGAGIKSVSTVPMANMLGVSSVVDAVEDRAVQVLDEQLGREIDRALAVA